MTACVCVTRATCVALRVTQVGLDDDRRPPLVQHARDRARRGPTIRAGRSSSSTRSSRSPARPRAGSGRRRIAPVESASVISAPPWRIPPAVQRRSSHASRARTSSGDASTSSMPELDGERASRRRRSHLGYADSVGEGRVPAEPRRDAVPRGVGAPALARRRRCRRARSPTRSSCSSTRPSSRSAAAPRRASCTCPDGAEVEVVETDRGGKSTYHGPGQLVCYPILDLTRHGQDVKQYCRDLEEALIRTLAPFGLEARRIDGLTGVWLTPPPAQDRLDRVHISKWVTTHGYALNVDLDPAPFTEWITACGLEDAAFTTMAPRARPADDASTRCVRPPRRRARRGVRPRARGASGRRRRRPLAAAAARPPGLGRVT